MRVGIDLGGSHMGIGLVTEDGNLIAKKERDILEKEKDNIKNILEKEIVEAIYKLLEQTCTSMSEITKIGIGCAGTVADGKIINAHNLKIEEFPITDVLKKYFSVEITVRNDAKAASVAEKLYGSMKEYDDCLFLTLGTGIGGAVYLNGELLVPKKASGFEIGHMIIDKKGKPCTCGKIGCFETYCSMKSLKKQVVEAMNLPTTIDGKMMHSIIMENMDNPKMQRTIDIFVENLCVGLSNLANIFEPEIISIGGSFTHYGEFFIEKIQEKWKSGSYLFNENSPIIKCATMKNDAGIIGAAMECH